MKIEVLTLFPAMFHGILHESILGRAQKSGILETQLIDIRDYGLGKHRKVDAEPYGGGPGMLLRCEPIFEALENLLKTHVAPPHLVLTSPQGRPFHQGVAAELAQKENIVLLCGHYEGFDERIRAAFPWDEISIGDYVLTGGELPAMVIIDALTRLQPGALGASESIKNESFEDDLLEYPQYTRPECFKDMHVPEVLLSGNHGEIAAWRKQKAQERTLQRRPDLFRDKKDKA